MSLLDIIPTPVKAGIALVAVVALSTFYLQHRAAIYRDGYEDAVHQVEQEIKIQEAANKEAMRLANSEYIKSTETLLLEEEQLNAAVTNFKIEAAADAGAASCGIGLGSVQRLNNVR